MPATGRHFGLEKTPLYDGRHDIYAATDAALNYLQYLHGMFGDWSLALAAYNWGEGNVGRAVNRARAQGLEPTYENLRMPNETRNYVPKLLDRPQYRCQSANLRHEYQRNQQPAVFQICQHRQTY